MKKVREAAPKLTLKKESLLDLTQVTGGALTAQCYSYGCSVNVKCPDSN